MKISAELIAIVHSWCIPGQPGMEGDRRLTPWKSTMFDWMWPKFEEMLPTSESGWLGWKDFLKDLPGEN